MILEHNEQQCYVEYLELYPKREEKEETDNQQKEKNTKNNNKAECDLQKRKNEQRQKVERIQKDNNQGKFKEQRKKIGGNKNRNQGKWRQETRWNKVGVAMGNQFDALGKTEQGKDLEKPINEEAGKVRESWT